ncbi:MAG: polysaccharide biosynthesis/export family protein [Bacteroidales bacterium]|nr:polysaccharide biosynthesis/export family protein [Bacteroidales bacterium]
MSGFREIGIAVLITATLASCVPNKKILYVQDSREMLSQQNKNMYFIDEPLDNSIRQGDELYIKVSSADETQTNFNQSRQETVQDPSVISYTVDDEGYIKLPYINRVKLSGLTLVQASDHIEEELAQYLLYPSVFIRFVNNKVTILGEVNRPGVYVFNYKSVNILQAIGYANDVATFGNRKNVLIIREEGEYRSKYEIDLTSDALLTSEYYMVKSNDIIYVEPLKSKKWGMDTFPYDLLLSMASLTIVVLTFMVTYLN